MRAIVSRAEAAGLAWALSCHQGVGTGATGATGGLSSVTIVTGGSATPTGSDAVGTLVGPVTATCTTGTLVGGGANVTNTAGKLIVAVTSSYPSASNTWSAAGTVVHGSANPPTLTVYALCAH